MTYSEVHRLPIRYRTWFLRRLAKHFEDKNQAYEDAKNKNSNRNSSSRSENSLQKLSQFESQIKSKQK